MRYVILGTAGHIDHGKSSLVKALTGIDPDRLKEEKERGITIDLGFAYLEYPDGLTVGIVDVPGHERLIRNMLAGAGGIDILLLVISADEGIMPQTKEHLAICDLLNIKSGIIVLTKADLVDNEWLELLKEEIRTYVKGTFLENAEIIPVSSKTLLNIELLKEKIHDLSIHIKPKSSRGVFRMPVDRVFTLKGFGTVVTGTVISGSINLDDYVEILPASKKAKVRGLQSHGKPITKGFAGQRLAINLQGVEKEEIERGDTVVLPDIFKITRMMNVKLILLNDSPPLRHRENLHLYLGTSETIARVILFEGTELKPGESAYCQLRTEKPLITTHGDRFIIRRISPLETIGGGIILDPWPSRRRYPEILNDMEVFFNGNIEDKLEKKIERSTSGIRKSDIPGWIQEDLDVIENTIRNLIKKGIIFDLGDTLYHRNYVMNRLKSLIDLIKSYHRKNPLKIGLSREEARNILRIDQKLFDKILSLTDELITDKGLLRHRDFKTDLIESGLRERILRELNSGGLQVPFRSELSNILNIDEKRLSDILKILVNEGSIIKINDQYYLTPDTHKKLLEETGRIFKSKESITVSDFKDHLGISRKFAIPLLEYLDANKITLRIGDVRRLLRPPLSESSK